METFNASTPQEVFDFVRRNPGCTLTDMHRAGLRIVLPKLVLLCTCDKLFRELDPGADGKPCWRYYPND